MSFNLAKIKEFCKQKRRLGREKFTAMMTMKIQTPNDRPFHSNLEIDWFTEGGSNIGFS